MVMQGEQPTRIDQDMIGLIGELQNKLDSDQEFSRRAILKGLGAVSVLTALQGIAAVEKLGGEDKEALQAVLGDVCPDLDVRCYLKQADLDVPAAFEPQATVEGVLTDVQIVPETTVSLPPAPPSPPPPAPEVIPPLPPASEPIAMEIQAARSEVLPAPERRNMTYEQFLQNAEQYLNVLPRLEQMNALFPGTAFFHHIPEQLQHINNLKETVQPSVEKYHGFTYDMAHSNMFNQTRPLSPRAFLWHWTGQYYETPEGLSGMKPNSVQLYVHHDAVAYQVVPHIDVVAGHARVMNDFTWGMEMHSGHYDDVHSPIFNFTQGQVEIGIYTAVRQLRSHNLPVNRFTILGHYAADLIFMNPYYDPATGAFHEVNGHMPKVHKFDPPQEFMDMVVEKAVVLDNELGPR